MEIFEVDPRCVNGATRRSDFQSVNDVICSAVWMHSVQIKINRLRANRIGVNIILAVKPAILLDVEGGGIQRLGTCDHSLSHRNWCQVNSVACLSDHSQCLSNLNRERNLRNVIRRRGGQESFHNDRVVSIRDCRRTIEDQVAIRVVQRNDSDGESVLVDVKVGIRICAASSYSGQSNWASKREATSCICVQNDIRERTCCYRRRARNHVTVLMAVCL